MRAIKIELDLEISNHLLMHKFQPNEYTFDMSLYLECLMYYIDIRSLCIMYYHCYIVQ